MSWNHDSTEQKGRHFVLRTIAYTIAAAVAVAAIGFVEGSIDGGLGHLLFG